jgi:uncharacterized protein
MDIRVHGLKKINKMRINKNFNAAYLEMTKESPDLKSAFNSFLAACNESYPPAFYVVATWYLNGQYVKKNYIKGNFYLRKACNYEIPEAFYDLAVSYEMGMGVKKNLRQAYENYMIAALLGDQQGIDEVARCLYYGVGTRKSKKLTDAWMDHANALRKNSFLENVLLNKTRKEKDNDKKRNQKDKDGNIKWKSQK